MIPVFSRWRMRIPISSYLRRIKGIVFLCFLPKSRTLSEASLSCVAASFYGRPAVVPACCGFLGAHLAFFLPLPIACFIAALSMLLLTGMAGMFIKDPLLRRRAFAGMILSAVFLLYVFVSIASQRILAEKELQERASEGRGMYDEYDGRILSISVSQTGYRTLIIRLNSGAKVLCGTNESWPSEGMRIGVNGFLRQIAGGSNPGSFDQYDYYSRKGVFMEIRSVSSGVEKLDDPNGISFALAELSSVGTKLRTNLRDAWSLVLDEEDAGLLCAMLLGDTSGISRVTRMNFRLLNLSHLTAVSGANIAFFLIPATEAARHLTGNRKLRTAALLVFLGFVGFLTGWNSTVSRAICIACIHLLSNLMSKRHCPISSLSASVCLLLFLNPFCGVDIGFGLSVSATLALSLFSDKLSGILQRLRIKKCFSDLLSPIVCANIGMMPWLIVLSGRESIFLLLVNIIGGLLAEGISSIGLSASFFLPALFLSARSQPFLKAVFLPVRGLLSALRFFANCSVQFGITSFRLNTVDPLIPISVALCILILVIPHCFLRRILSALITVPIMIGMVSTIQMYRNAPIATVIFLDVGQGDAALVLLKDGRSVMIDAGTQEEGENTVIPVLNYYGIVAPDLTVLTHLHSDHGGGFLPLLTESRTKTIVTPFLSSGSELDEVFRIAASQNVETPILSKDDRIILSETASITVLGPDEITENGGNADSAVLLLTVGTTGILFMGDAGLEQERQMLDDFETAKMISSLTDILKVGHHGSKYSSGEEFLEIVDPEAAVISVGENNYGHPSSEVLSRLSACGAAIFRTDRNGAVIVEIYKDSARVSAYRDT